MENKIRNKNNKYYLVVPFYLSFFSLCMYVFDWKLLMPNRIEEALFDVLLYVIFPSVFFTIVLRPRKLK